MCVFESFEYNYFQRIDVAYKMNLHETWQWAIVEILPPHYLIFFEMMMISDCVNIAWKITIQICHQKTVLQFIDTILVWIVFFIVFVLSVYSSFYVSFHICYVIHIIYKQFFSISQISNSTKTNLYKFDKKTNRSFSILLLFFAIWRQLSAKFGATKSWR